MPPRTTKHSVAASLAAALLLAAAQQVRSQELPLAPAIEPSPGVDLRDEAPLGSRDMTADPTRGDLLRGPAGDAATTGANADDAAPGAANYGAPRPKTKLPKPYPPHRVHAGAPHPSKNPLPPLEPYKTSAAARRALRLHPRADAPAPEPTPTVAAAPTIKAKPKPVVELNPYDPVGIGVGSLRLTPFVETSTGYDSNPDRLSSSNVPAPTGSRLLRADAGFQTSLRLGAGQCAGRSAPWLCRLSRL